MTVRILQGDAAAVLKTLPDESVHCVVTSPPYWGLRDYGVELQLGLEPTPQAYVENMVAVFREVRRVLRDDGTLWLNMGDSYASTPPGNKGTGVEKWATSGLHGAVSAAYAATLDASVSMKRNTIAGGLKPKDLCGMPWRLAFALQADGWWLRQDIIWAKPNPMPESVRDRCTKAHEYLFLLAKSERYYFDAEAIAEAGVTGDLRKPYAPGQVDARGNGHDRGGGKPRTAGKLSAMPKQSSGHRIVENVARAREDGAEHDSPFGATRNKRSVWTVTTQPFKEAHFATFPPALIEPCVLAGCPAGGTVLDPFFGAGTTGIVADRLGRNCIGIELNPAYVTMAERRMRGTTMALELVA